MWKLLWVAVACAGLAGCDGGTEPQGGEGERCYPNATCDAGLSCVSDRCVDLGEQCGNGVCDPGETNASCPGDCPVETHCGDNRAEGDEVCDGTDLDSLDCTDQGFAAGELACAADCLSFVTAGCTHCGDDLLDAGEACDGSELDGQGCASQGFATGELACAADCLSFVTTGCTDCGDNVLDPGESCDGTALALHDCGDHGYFGGQLACAADCLSFVTTGCTNCGNDLLDAGETCDGTALDGEDCASQGFFTGQFACAADCLSFVTAGCTNCGDGDIDAGEACDVGSYHGLTCAALGFSGGELACAADCSGVLTEGCQPGCEPAPDCRMCSECAMALACGQQASDCLGQWGCMGYVQCVVACPPGDPVCVTQCGDFLPEIPPAAAGLLSCLACSACDASCAGLPVTCTPPAGCGNGALDAGELCDGALLDGHGCAELGMIGQVSCGWDCLSLDFSGCNLCGNGRADVDRGELCDGGDLAGQTCQGLGLLAGQLACRPDCAGFDLTGCVGCGNGRLEAGEFCDGAFQGPPTCADLGYAGGELGCTADCLHASASSCVPSCDQLGDCYQCSQCSATGACQESYDACMSSSECMDFGLCIQDCMDPACNDDCVALYPEGVLLYQAALDCIYCDACPLSCGSSCPADPLCGNGTLDPGEVCDPTAPVPFLCEDLGMTGSVACSADCRQVDLSDCTMCGDGRIDPGEPCDGGDLGGATCQTLGYEDGELACLPGCAGLDTASCIGAPSCDNSGDCEGCTQCALDGSGPCGAAVSACHGSGECTAFEQCILDCYDDICIQDCIILYPAGADLYLQLVDCVYCDACPNDCVDYAGSC